MRAKDSYTWGTGVLRHVLGQARKEFDKERKKSESGAVGNPLHGGSCQINAAVDYIVHIHYIIDISHLRIQSLYVS